ncbi:hypothetical protein [Micromonospora maris]|uniref:hypothetical protein n=2 Tax=Micromonospora TaxID=1873 RepID=UPI002E1081FA|nr:hypothetical protein OG712_18260 [Micromonospora maris]
MTTTYRLLRQTSRTSRFAVVTVEVEPSRGPEVKVTAAVTAAHRREADLGARWALRSLPAAAKVTVTDVLTTEVDTLTGDVHEATARAVWQALGIEHPTPYVGFGDPRMVASWLEDMAGRRLEAVTEARHWYGGRCEPDATSLLHAWLCFESALPVGLHGSGDQLRLAKEDPYGSYDMGEHGETRVGPALRPGILSGFVGARLVDGAVIIGPDGDLSCAGLVLRFDTGDLVVGTLGDEWVLAVGSIPAAVAPSWTVQPFVRGAS